ncbi:general odorant-binding protein 67-like [Ochlerotatus camptorhynchus]|uniref:general odorant-binding protein 67-like n=1 Tax=Ochlerotatus camptorhynchus TaxID=644619 RepID=UPI0031DCD3B8
MPRMNSFSPDPTCFEISTSKRADDCCLIPKPYDNQQVSDCLLSMGNPTDATEKYKCLVACIAKKLNVYKDNNLDREAALRLFNLKIGSNPNFAPIIGSTFDQCYRQLSVNMAYEQSNPPNCSALPMLLLNCLQSSLFLNCPTGVWKVGSECDELKRKLTKGCPFVAIS